MEKDLNITKNFSHFIRILTIEFQVRRIIGSSHVKILDKFLSVGRTIVTEQNGLKKY